MIALSPCSACGKDAAKERVGSLGETRGVWCTECGDSTDDVAQWQARGSVAKALGYSATPLYPIRYHLPTASGVTLDRIADLHGLVRGRIGDAVESDEALRARVQSQYLPPKGTP